MSSQSRRLGLQNHFLALAIGAPITAAAAPMPSPAPSPVPYYITGIQVVNLGTLDGDQSAALDINDRSEIVGWSENKDVLRRAFLYRNATMTDITPANQAIAEAHGINNKTQMVGFFTASEGAPEHAFFRNDLQPAVTLYEANDDTSCGTGANAQAINDAAVITGDRLVNCGPGFVARPVRWTSQFAPWEELLPNIVSPASSHSHNINASGVIVGEELQGYYSYTGAYFWIQGVVADVPVPADLPPPQWWYTGTARAFGINTAGNIVGDIDFRPDGINQGEIFKRAIYWNGQSAAALGLAIFSDGKNAGAREIDDEGFMVGWGDRLTSVAGYQKRGAVWHRDFGIAELPLPGGYGPGFQLQPNYCEAFAVNKRSSTGLVQAVGYCHLNGRDKAMLWNISTARKHVVGPVLTGTG